jgi:hypothetical protein
MVGIATERSDWFWARIVALRLALGAESISTKTWWSAASEAVSRGGVEVELTVGVSASHR